MVKPDVVGKKLLRATAWLSDQWDRQIEADAVAGKLDRLIKEADEDFEAGQCTELHLPIEDAL